AVAVFDKMDREPQSKKGRQLVRQLKDLLDKFLDLYPNLSVGDQMLCAPAKREIKKIWPVVMGTFALSSRLPAQSSAMKRAASREAHELLLKYDQEPVTTPKGNWDRLTAILAGVELDRHGKPTASM